MRRPAFALATLFAAGAAAAQELRLVYREQEHEVCTLRATAYGGAAMPVGAGFVRLEVENADSRAHLVAVDVASTTGENADVRLPREWSLPPHERAVAFLPLPRPLGNLRVTLRVERVEQVGSMVISRGNGIIGLLIADLPDAQPAALQRMQALAPTPEVAACLASEAPPDWRLYTAFHAVIVDGRARVGVPVQEALRRAAFAGELVLVAGPEALVAGPLRVLASAARNGVLAFGLGRIVAIPPLDTPMSRTAIAAAGSLDASAVPLDLALSAPQTIPGLGEAPVTAFVLVMLLFAIVAGPVNFMLLRRWRRPLLAIATVPLLGFGTTAVILVYGLLHDGFGVRGVVASWTCLDQARHEVAAIAARTLFAGLAPGALAMGPDSLLVAPRTTARVPGATDRWHYDGANGTLDGGALPSRTPTPWTTVQQGVARQRLVAQRVGTDELRLQSDGGIATTGEVVLRDLDGAWFVGRAPRLRRATAEDAIVVLDGLRRTGGGMTQELVQETSGAMRSRRHRFPETETTTEWRSIGAVADRVFGDALPPGTWVAQVSAAPWLDEHGLSVRYDQARHYVRGSMQAEDFVR